jgi:benzoate/toluate 1,2-dioxygenase reductase component
VAAVAGRFTSKIRHRRWLAPGTFETVLARPPGFRFQAGQRIRIRLQDRERDYSLVSSPSDDHISLCVRRIPGDGVSDALSRLDPGAPVCFDGPLGYLAWRPSPRQAVFVASGTGVAPFVAMARSGVGGFLLMHGVRHAAQLYYGETLRRAARRYIPCLSRSGDPDAAGIFRGRVTDYLTTELAPGPYDFYLCGRREMIRDATFIVDERFAGARLYPETFF